MKPESDWDVRHIDDSEAAAMIHASGQDPVVDARVRSHISHCDACAERLESLRAADRQAGILLSSLDVRAPVISAQELISAGKRVPSEANGARYRRAAAIVGFMVIATGAAAAIPNSPVRQLITRIRESVRQQTGDAQRRPRAGIESVVAPAVSMVPESTLDVVFAEGATAGTVRVGLVDGAEVSLSSPDSGSRYRVGPARIDVDHGSATTFELLLPRSLARVRILIGGKLVFERQRGAGGPQDFTIDLAPPNQLTPSR